LFFRTARRKKEEKRPDAGVVREGGSPQASSRTLDRKKGGIVCQPRKGEGREKKKKEGRGRRSRGGR